MFNPEQEELISQTVRTSQIIAFALISGVLIFAFVIVLTGLANDEPPETPLVSIVGFVFAAVSVLVAPIVSKAIAAMMRRTALSGKQTRSRQFQEQQKKFGSFGLIVGSYLTKQIVRRALLEGAAFMNLIAYIIDAQSLNLALAIFLALAMLFDFPSRDRLERYVREQMNVIEQLKTLRG